ncbi:hypothetical protein C8N24_5350 [Solirubrobacter pauli]|uniref:DUF4190 domain-containing protein n=2 Tax=Solirubrobacter pauli TaxID=166793 RepID=A0A660L324_9ACTN|nr:hypothetical protein C8N24_5350 [Solirubrobacter pauli]
MRMQLTTRAPLAVPSLVVGVLSAVLLVFGPVLFALIAAVGAIVMGGIALADVKSHGYQGHGFAVGGMIVSGTVLALAFIFMVSTAG